MLTAWKMQRVHPDIRAYVKVIVYQAFTYHPLEAHANIRPGFR